MTASSVSVSVQLASPWIHPWKAATAGQREIRRMCRGGICADSVLEIGWRWSRTGSRTSRETSVHIPLRLLITVLAVVFVIKVIARVGRHSREVVSHPMRIRRHVERCRDRFSSVRERFSNVRRRRALSVGFAMLLAAAFSATLLAAAWTLFWWSGCSPHQRWVYIDASDSWMRTTTDAPREMPTAKTDPTPRPRRSIAAPPKPAAPPAASVPPPDVLHMAKPKRSTAFAAVTGALAETFRKAGRCADVCRRSGIGSGTGENVGGGQLVRPNKAGPAGLGLAAERRIDDSVQVCVSTAPHASSQECEPELAEQIQVKVGEFIERQLSGEDPAAVSKLRLPLEFIHDQIVRATYREAVENPLTTPIVKLRDDASSPSWIRLHTRLVFDRQTRLLIDQQWNEVVLARRLETAGFGLASLLLVVGIAWGYLKADLATSGAYRDACGSLPFRRYWQSLRPSWPSFVDTVPGRSPA